MAVSPEVKQMNTIKFSKNWNNKLDCDYFTTIRLYTKNKHQYYKEMFDGLKEVGILLNGKEKCIAKIVDIKVLFLIDIPSYLIITDTGLPILDFYVLMENMYKNKPEWDNDFTKMIVLTIKKVREI